MIEFPNTPSPHVPHEPSQVSVHTPIPGPASEALRQRHAEVQDARTVHFYTHATRSLGNYIVDADGNTLLDLYGHIAALPLGYNHPDLLSAWRNGRFDWTAGWRPALGVSPPIEWVELVEGPLSRLAPKGLPSLLTVTTGAEALENAFKLAFIEFSRRRRGGGPGPAEMSACLENAQTEANKLKILSFEGAFHGRSLGALSATRSKAIHKVDFPAFSWPVAPFPATRFPVADYAAENAAAEARSLEAVEAAFVRHLGEIAAVVVEPIQGEGGDRHASPAFFHALQRICKAHGALFIVDEVQTGGGGCGVWWQHSTWDLPEPPDILCFSKKMQIGGCYFRKDLMPAEPYRIFNTFLGDPLRAAQLAVVAEVVERDHLLENTRITGDFLLSGLQMLQNRFPGLLSQARGVGTWCAFDVCDVPKRDRLVHLARQKGLELGGTGVKSIRFRPALIFAPRHAAEALSILNDVCLELAQ